MAIPSATETVRDFGLGLTQPASMIPLVLGVSSLGDTNAVELYNSVSALKDARGEGPAVEAAANVLSNGGGPIAFVGLASTIAGSNSQVLPTYGADGTIGALTQSGAGPVIALSGTDPNGDYDVRIEITTGGALETAVFRWSIDGGSSWEAEGVVTVAGGVHVLSTDDLVTGLTATFPAGTYVLNETYDWAITPGGGEVSVAGESTLDLRVRIEIMSDGALGEATFRYSLDGYSGDTESERTYSEVLTIPSGGTFVLANTGLTLTFDDDPTEFVEGDFYVFDAEAGAWNATDLANGFTAIAASSAQWRFCVAVTSKANGDATAHALLAASLQSQLTTLANSSKYRRGMIAATHEDTAAVTAAAFLNTTAARLLIAYGQVRRSTTKPFPGFAFPVTNAVDVIAARAAGSLPSTDLKRKRSGSLAEVVKLFHDEYRSPSTLDNVKISTLRTYEQGGGYYVTQGRLKSAAGSDFRYWPHGIVMDIACETINEVLTNEIGRGTRFVSRNADGDEVPDGDPSVEYTGTIDDRDAIAIEDEANRRLIARLASPLNAEGFAGHVTDLRFRILRTQDVLSTGAVLGEVGIKSLVYIDQLTTTLGFVVELPQAA